MNAYVTQIESPTQATRNELRRRSRSIDEQQVIDENYVFSLHSFPRPFAKIKRMIDVVFSAVMLITLTPLFLVIAVLIKLSSKGPVLFSQTRVGMGGRHFKMYKFRTMVTNAEELKLTLLTKNEQAGPVFKIKKDPRITKIGAFLRKFSLDELPQFANVLIGDMSVVGPRPPVPSEVRQYLGWQARRLSVKPGLTCIWQVSGRNHVDFAEWVRMDLRYIEQASPRVDSLLVAKTILAVAKADGAY